MNAVLEPVPACRYFTKCRVPGIYPCMYPFFRVFTPHKGRVRVWDVVPVPRVLWHGRVELTEVSGTGMNVARNLHKFFVGYYPGKYPGYGCVCTLQNETGITRTSREVFYIGTLCTPEYTV